MTKMYFITDLFEEFATVCNSLEEYKEEYVERVLDSGSSADVVLIADAIKIEEFSNLSAESVLIRYEGDENRIYHLDCFNNMDNFKNEMARQVYVCKNEKIECEAFALTNIQRFKSKVTVTFEPC